MKSCNAKNTMLGTLPLSLIPLSLEPQARASMSASLPLSFGPPSTVQFCYQENLSPLGREKEKKKATKRNHVFTKLVGVLISATIRCRSSAPCGLP